MQRIFNRSSCRISLAQAFTAQGVTLRDPQRSWSGVRDADGAVVIAIRKSAIQATDRGFRCLLWAPLGERQETDEPRMEERLAHCRLALLVGNADGLVVSGTDQVQPGSLLAMEIEKWHEQYWATWRFAAPIAIRPGKASWRSEPAELLAAA